MARNQEFVAQLTQRIGGVQGNGVGAAEQVGHGRATGCNGAASHHVIRWSPPQVGARVTKRPPRWASTRAGTSKRLPGWATTDRWFSPPPVPAAGPHARRRCRYADPGWSGSARRPWAGRFRCSAAGRTLRAACDCSARSARSRRPAHAAGACARLPGRRRRAGAVASAAPFPAAGRFRRRGSECRAPRHPPAPSAPSRPPAGRTTPGLRRSGNRCASSARRPPSR
ncbi:hypothetical protein G6F68_012992 [Rhizopus microsporus]|nr:hypothetical protein G6F68_012992 [Rhizopus microsporus]